MFEKAISRLLGKVEKEYTLDIMTGEDGNPYAIARANVGIGDKEYPCDTTINLEPGQSNFGDKITFTTFIHPGMEGDNIEPMEKVVDVLNYIYPGKFVHDISDGSQDLLYTTSERVNGLNPGIIRENIEHHAQVKAQVAPELDLLVLKLGLEPKSSETPSELFAKDWDTFFRDTSQYLQEGTNITYLPAIKKKK